MFNSRNLERCVNFAHSLLLSFRKRRHIKTTMEYNKERYENGDFKHCDKGSIFISAVFERQHASLSTHYHTVLSITSCHVV